MICTKLSTGRGGKYHPPSLDQIISEHPDQWPEIPLLSIFWRSGLENVKITHFQVPKKWDFKRPNPKTETTPLEKNGGLDICFCVYHFWLRNEQILNILTSFSTKCWPSQKTPGKKCIFYFIFRMYRRVTATTFTALRDALPISSHPGSNMWEAICKYVQYVWSTQGVAQMNL